MKIAIALLLTALAEAIEVSPQPAGVSLTTITATSVDVVTSTTTTSFAITTTTPSCEVATAQPDTASCVSTIWSSGTRYFSQDCASADFNYETILVGDTGSVAYSSCVNLCLSKSTCLGVRYINSYSICEYLSGGVTVVTAGASFNQAMVIYTTNPCTEVETTLTTTETLVDTSTVTYTTLCIKFCIQFSIQFCIQFSIQFCIQFCIQFSIKFCIKFCIQFCIKFCIQFCIKFGIKFCIKFGSIHLVQLIHPAISPPSCILQASHKQYSFQHRQPHSDRLGDYLQHDLDRLYHRHLYSLRLPG
ncbi:hypothetical protein ASPZODRAFT_14203 [Penicilliopsis zonata CBS 506.65]|uniref:Apple domain-containing protein n=1 Tax=Penicilliopsis zonata CBS 506.65 TaxID=1073090 RepID=A0A1L9SQV5_9EURO|nr:hypothetical protein ASPZODRAFT_14203 [Penicilliopsis zonata CBS 506.65]OJJ49487.1 hypothetical protein ASPZODRAFT_14203 [Penicilliopsis zonata CBS 506.65]